RGAAGSLHDGRGLHGTQARGGRSRLSRTRVHPEPRRCLARACLHEVLPGATGALAVAVDRPDAAGSDPAPTGRALLRLQLLLLGATDRGPALGRPGAAPGAPGSN